MPTETRTFEVGPYVVRLTAQIAGGEVGATTIDWLPDRPGRLTSEQWVQFRQGKERALADMAAVATQDAQKPRANAQAPIARPPRDRAPAALLASRRALPVQATRPLHGEGVASLADDDPFGGTP